MQRGQVLFDWPGERVEGATRFFFVICLVLLLSVYSAFPRGYGFPQISFVNLYELVEYYRREPLKSAAFKMILKNAVPQPAPHENEKWFHKELLRPHAEDMLKRIRFDGAFLVRESEAPGQYAISFR